MITNGVYMVQCKTVNDPVHGTIEIGGVFLDILNSHEMQRLRHIKQLGFGSIAFPGANHTRFEHCLGTYHLAGRMAKAIKLNEEDTNTVKAAALLHDICHPPYSHTMEFMMEQGTGLDHMDLARALIEGKIANHLKRDEDLYSNAPLISEMLEGAGISSKTVCDLIAYPESDILDLDSFIHGVRPSYFPSKDYMHQIIHGPVDADQMDYLMRDAHYTGVSHGSIDINRLINMLRIHNDRIVLYKGGTAAAEGLMVSRSLMYSSVYFHKTVRIAEAMINKATELSKLDLSEIYLYTDGDFTSRLIGSEGIPSKLTRQVVGRQLYKKAFIQSVLDTDESRWKEISGFASFDKKSQLEHNIADCAGVDYSEVLVVVPSKTSLSDMVSIGKTDVSIIDEDDRVRSLVKISPLSRAVQARDSLDWALMVAAPERCKEAVKKATRKVLSL